MTERTPLSLLVAALVCSAGCQHVPSSAPPPDQPAPPVFAHDAPPAPPDLTIEVHRGERQIQVNGAGLGFAYAPGTSNVTDRFVIAAPEVEGLLATIRAAGFFEMPIWIGVPFSSAPVHDWVVPPEKPPVFTRTPPLHSLRVLQGPGHHWVTQSGEGEFSAPFAALVASIGDALDCAARERPLTTRDVAEELRLVRDGKLSLDLLHLAASQTVMRGGVAVSGWTFVLDGRRVTVTRRAPDREWVGGITDAELAELLDALMAGPLPGSAYVRAPHFGFLWVRVANQASFQVNDSRSLRIAPADQAAFDRALALAVRLADRIAAP